MDEPSAVCTFPIPLRLQFQALVQPTSSWEYLARAADMEGKTAEGGTMVSAVCGVGRTSEESLDDLCRMVADVVDELLGEGFREFSVPSFTPEEFIAIFGYDRQPPTLEHTVHERTYRRRIRLNGKSEEYVVQLSIDVYRSTTMAKRQYIDPEP